MGRSSNKRLNAAALIKWQRREYQGRTLYEATLSPQSQLELPDVLIALWKKFLAVVESDVPGDCWDLIICEVWPDTGSFALYPATLGRYLGDSEAVVQVSLPAIARLYDRLPDPVLEDEAFEAQYDEMLDGFASAIEVSCERVLGETTGTNESTPVYLIDSPEEVSAESLVFVRGKKIPPKKLRQEPKPPERTGEIKSALDRLERVFGCFQPSEVGVGFDTNERIKPKALEEAIDEVLKLPQLADLSLATTPATDQTVGRISELSALRSLDLEGTRVSASCVKHLTKLSKLQVLALSRTAINDKAMQQLSRMTSLERLLLEKTPIGDVAIRSLAALPRLEALYVSRTNITDRAMGYLSGHKRLKIVDVCNTKVTDAGIMQLTSLKNLEELNVRGSRVTAAGLAPLRKRFPELEVDLDLD